MRVDELSADRYVVRPPVTWTVHDTFDGNLNGQDDCTSKSASGESTVGGAVSLSSRGIADERELGIGVVVQNRYRYRIE